MKTSNLPNRTLEFRAWHVPTQTMHYGVSFNDDFVLRMWDDSKSDSENYKAVDHPFRRTDCVLMQFSNCLDPTGAKVWEGDILRFDIEVSNDESRMDDEVDYSSFYLVFFHSGCFCSLRVDDLKDDPDTWDPFLFNDGVSDLVVGNRWEHPYFLDIVGEMPLKFEPIPTRMVTTN